MKNQTCWRFIAAWVVSCALSVGQAAETLYFSLLAGSPTTPVTSQDGTGAAAQFYEPRGVARDSAGNLYVADSGNHTIRKITPAGVVTTLAGTPGSAGRTDGTGSAARFTEPWGLTVDSTGVVWVADTGNNAIRKITPAGVVTTFISDQGQGGQRLAEPRGIVQDSSGNFYVADYSNHVIRKITSAGVISTFAGTVGTPGLTDGAGTAARLRFPISLSIDSAGHVYVADTENREVRKITSSGQVTTVSVSTTGTTKFNHLRGIGIDAAGNIYLSDYNDHVIKKLTPTGTLSTLAGTQATPGTADGNGTSARFDGPSGLVVGSDGTVFVTDTSSATIRQITPSAQVSTFAGLAGRSSSSDGTGSNARFQDPYAVAIDSTGSVYVADISDHSIRKISTTGAVTTLAGTPGSFGLIDGTGSSARFRGPRALTVDAAGTVYVADTGNRKVRKITAAGVVTTIANTSPFGELNGIAVHSDGQLYLVDGGAVKRLDPNTGTVTTIAGQAVSGLLNGQGTAAKFLVPFALAIDAAGNLYVCDHGNHVVRKVTPSGAVTTLAGTGNAGYADGAPTTAMFKFPSGIAVTPDGSAIFVADTDNQRIRRIEGSTGQVSTVGGTSLGYVHGLGTNARVYNPKNLATDSAGRLWIADRGNRVIRIAQPLSDAGASARCLFDWAETNYASLFTPASTSTTGGGYTYRCYTATGNCLGVGNTDNHLWFYSAGRLNDLGLLTNWLTPANCK